MSFPILGVRPRLVSTLFIGLALLILLALGSWQIERLMWKTNLLHTIAERMSAPPRPLNGANLGPVADYERVQVEGQFLHDRELHMFARSMVDNEVGYQILTPFQIAGGGTVLINRGFVPSDRLDPSTRLGGQVQGTVTVSGVVRFPSKPTLYWLIPENRPGENMWIWPDLPRMAVSAGLASIAPFVIEADKASDPDSLPVGGQVRLNIPNDHLQYAITWFALAIALVVMFIVFHRRRAKPDNGKKPD